MAYTISDACVNCGACEGECPVSAISEKGSKREIDAEHAPVSALRKLFRKRNASRFRS